MQAHPASPGHHRAAAAETEADRRVAAESASKPARLGSFHGPPNTGLRASRV